MGDVRLNSDPSCSSSPPSEVSPPSPESSSSIPFRNGVMPFMLSVSAEHLQRFKQLLLEENPRPNCTPLTWDQLKSVRCGEVVHLLTEYFPGRRAWEVAHDIFAKMNQTELCVQIQRELNEILPNLEPEDLNQRKRELTLEEDESDKIREYKARVMSEHSALWDRTSWPGNNVDFFYQEPCREDILLQCLLLPRKPQGRQPKTVVLLGDAGLGKTTVAKKVMLEWAEDKFYAHKVWFAFYLRCQEMDGPEERSFSELIACKLSGSLALASRILSHPEHLLLLLDGFEELTLTLVDRPEDLSQDWSQKMPGSVLLTSLLSKTMLPDATIIVFLRFNMWKTVSPFLKDPSLITLTGFSAPERSRYFRSYFKNGRDADAALRFAMGSAVLFSMCRAPVTCWLVCSCLKQQMDRDSSLPQAFPNAAAVFVHCLSSLLPTQARHAVSETHQEQVKRLCSLAAEGMWKDQWVFGETDCSLARLDERDVQLFLRAQVLRRVAADRALVAFTHPSFQEFFAALLFILCFPQRLRNFKALDNFRVLQLLAHPGRWRNPLAGMALFLFGLLNDTCTLAVEQLLGCKVSLGNKRKLLKIAALPPDSEPPAPHHRLPQLFYYLYEIREEVFVGQILHDCRKALLVLSKIRDLQVSAFCLKFCRRLQELELTVAKMTSLSPGPLPSPHFRHVGSLVVSEGIIRVLVENQYLRHLEIENTQMRRQVIDALCTTLKHPRCFLQTLRLDGCPFDPTKGADLAWSLRKNTHLKTLMLRRGCLERDEPCVPVLAPQLERLSLENCDLTSLSYRSLAFSLVSNRSLTHLSLAENALQDDGAKELWKVLQNFPSTLQRLVLRNCALTSECCQDIASVLDKNKNLRSLDLGCNSLRDTGVILLCQHLLKPDSCLQVLELGECQFTSVCCPALTSVLLHNQTLRHLDLSGNSVGLQGAKLLQDAALKRVLGPRVVLKKKQSNGMDMMRRLEGPVVNKDVLEIVL
nr:NACHT, LRR and PYD domains-containing protein 8 [Odocoileus virginianus texanus]